MPIHIRLLLLHLPKLDLVAITRPALRGQASQRFNDALRWSVVFRDGALSPYKANHHIVPADERYGILALSGTFDDLGGGTLDRAVHMQRHG